MGWVEAVVKGTFGVIKRNWGAVVVDAAGRTIVDNKATTEEGAANGKTGVDAMAVALVAGSETSRHITAKAGASTVAGGISTKGTKGRAAIVAIGAGAATIVVEKMFPNLASDGISSLMHTIGIGGDNKEAAGKKLLAAMDTSIKAQTAGSGIAEDAAKDKASKDVEEKLKAYVSASIKERPAGMSREEAAAQAMANYEKRQQELMAMYKVEELAQEDRRPAAAATTQDGVKKTREALGGLVADRAMAAEEGRADDVKKLDGQITTARTVYMQTAMEAQRAAGATPDVDLITREMKAFEAKIKESVRKSYHPNEPAPERTSDAGSHTKSGQTRVADASQALQQSGVGGMKDTGGKVDKVAAVVPDAANADKYHKLA